ncbi:hypothetical protein LOTGIDRAFT_173484 [Lottia gigantea]|uniref:EGF-like domain-containing protein n=1 Tax=Lottia gigantea TaxID=225164 RepID=V4B0T1_LOTGI|nr:hypothetical protein LOTGIDRAFT_173484 [Lottia gigantea]ESO99826.1 hypothetical protein LOTGIDRAFT_173484 [Lottia gigantea]
MRLHYLVTVLVVLILIDVGEGQDNISKCLELPSVKEIVTRYICPKPDPCATVDCNCNGKCVDGKCQCKNGFFGEFCTALTSLIPKVAGFVSNNKSLISSEAQTIGSIAKAGVSKKSKELKELQQIRKLRNRRLEEKKGKDFKDIQKSLGSLLGFPWAKYPGEKHLQDHNYTGPGTRLDLRLDENDKPKPGGNETFTFDFISIMLGKKQFE